jgi:hypothetical protein
MSVLLLRTITRKSVIGFGSYRDLTVQNLLDLFKHKELLEIYYNCRNIDFNEDLKEELCIFGDRLINKKEPSEERYIRKARLYIALCINDIVDKRDEQQKQVSLFVKSKEKCSRKKRLAGKEIAFKSTIYSKGALRAKNQYT